MDHGFYVHGVGTETALLPPGWQSRLVEVAPDPGTRSIGLCLDPHDLCGAKIAALREKDRSFVSSLVDVGLIDPVLLRNRIANVETSKKHRARMRSFAEFLIRKRETSLHEA